MSLAPMPLRSSVSFPEVRVRHVTFNRIDRETPVQPSSSHAVVDPAPRPDRPSRTHGGLIRPSPLIPVGHRFRSCHARVHDHKVRPYTRARSHRAGRQRAHGSRWRRDGCRGDRRRRGRRRGSRVHGQRHGECRGGPRHDPVHRLRAEHGGLGFPDEHHADPGTAQGGGRGDAALPGRLLRRHLQLAGQHRPGRLRSPRAPTSTRSWARRRRSARSRSSSPTTAPAPRRRRRPGSSTPTSPRATASSTGRSATSTTATAIYGANWEADDYSDKSPAQYATELLQFASAMKAVDPSIKIGAVLTLPGNWPDSVVASGDERGLEPAGAVDRRAGHRLRHRALVPAELPGARRW